MIAPALEALARQVWAGTGIEQIYPRPIERMLGMRLPLSVLKISPVSIPSVGAWLAQQRTPALLPTDRGELMGCLVASRGHGLIFVCLADTPEEQRLTIAHETAHFIVDYLLPRRHVLEALGPAIAEVLDGQRPPTLAERAQAVLSHVRLGSHVHLLPRRGDDEQSDPEVANAEDRAESLAMELVAPRAEIHRLIQAILSRGLQPSATAPHLAQHFGLPAYAFGCLLQELWQPRQPSFLDHVASALRERQ